MEAVIYLLAFLCCVSGTLDITYFKTDMVNRIPSEDSDALFNVTMDGVIHCASHCFLEKEKDCHIVFFAADSRTCIGLTSMALQNATFQIQPYVVSFSEECTAAGFMLLTNISMCIKAFDVKMTWEDARIQCKNEGADLAIVDTEEKIAVISDYIRSRYTANKWYLGLIEGDTNGSWTWINNQTSSLVTSQFSRQTTNNCGGLHVKNVHLFEIECTATKRSICQKNLF